MRLNRQIAGRSPISLVAMIDVLMILLVFFMVTSTYLNLRMIPVARSTDAPTISSGGSTGGGSTGVTPLLIRLAADGESYLRGQPMQAHALQVALADRLAGAPDTQVVVLPSGEASTQALVTLLDAVTAAGVQRLRIVRLEGGE